MDSFWNAANALALLARSVAHATPDATYTSDAEAMANALQAAIGVFHLPAHHLKEGDMETWSGALLYASDACVLIFGALYPSTWAINEPMVPAVYAEAAALQAARMKRGERPGRLDELVDRAAAKDARRRWGAFCARDEHCSAWTSALFPLLKALLDDEQGMAAQLIWRLGEFFWPVFAVRTITDSPVNRDMKHSAHRRGIAE
mgnify:CR=1 FL=1